MMGKAGMNRIITYSTVLYECNEHGRRQLKNGKHVLMSQNDTFADTDCIFFKVKSVYLRVV